jgi:hypothetical protein
MDLALQIEQHLLAAGGFVPTGEICERFPITARALRQAGDRPGLLDAFAVSSTKSGEHGYIHHRHLPTREWIRIKHRLRRHAISELRRARAWDRARRNCTTRRPMPHERHTGQLIMAL